MRRPAIQKPAATRSPQLLAESYNPSIGLADRSRQIARPSADIHRAFIQLACRQTEWAARRAGCNGKTARSWARRGENAAVLPRRLPAGYHPVSSFAVQLSIHEPARSLGPLVGAVIRAKTALLMAQRQITKSSCASVARTAINHS
jgi:hypothetical protein